MQRVDIDRKQITPWPWLVGLAVLALIVWGVTTLLAAPQAEEQVAVTATEDTLPPAALPAPPRPVAAAVPPTVADPATLGDDHVGEVVRVEGEVVATGTTGYWMLADSTVLRVDSGAPVRKGQSVTVEARIEPADEERTDRIVAEVLSRHPQAETWRVVRSLKLVDRHEPERMGG